MVGHGESSAGSCLADPTSPIPSHCASTVVTSTVRVRNETNVVLLNEYFHYPVYMFAEKEVMPGRSGNSDRSGSQ